MSASIVYLSAPYADKRIVKYCHDHLKQTAPIPIVTAYQPAEWEKSHVSLYKNMLSGLAIVNTSHVYICEHDCIYPPEYFCEDDMCSRWSFSSNIEYLTRGGFIIRKVRKKGTLSTLYGNTSAIITAISEKLHEAQHSFVKWAEPGDGTPIRNAPRIIDIRHEDNFTGARFGYIHDYQRALKTWEAIDGVSNNNNA